MSQPDLAAVLADLGQTSLRQQALSQIESGQRAVKLGEALALARALGTSLDDLTRPAGLTAEAGRLAEAAREVRETGRQAAVLRRRHDAARYALALLIETAEKAGHVDALADEITLGRRALDDTEEAADGRAQG